MVHAMLQKLKKAFVLDKAIDMEWYYISFKLAVNLKTQFNSFSFNIFNHKILLHYLLALFNATVGRCCHVN